jgi:hypothetical protein
MKIELKLTADEMLYLDNKTTLALGVKFAELPKEKRTSWSIMIDVADKLSGKAKAIKRNTTLFDVKKKHKLSLKWHEADSLEKYLEAFTSYGHDSDYNKNLARKIIAQLNQKLA